MLGIIFTTLLIGNTLVVPVEAKVISSNVYYPRTVQEGSYFTITVEVVQNDKVGFSSGTAVYLNLRSYSANFYLTGPSKVKFSYTSIGNGVYKGAASLSFGTKVKGQGSISFYLTGCVVRYICTSTGNIWTARIQVT
jgi:hypothetical protein